MNFNTSPIAFYPSRAAQSWRAWFAQRKISVICGTDLLPFYIIDNGQAPASGELYEPNSDTKVADITLTPYLIDHTMTVNGVSKHIWIYQGGLAGVFGRTNYGYYYLKIGSWYSDIFCIGSLPAEYTEISWQFYDDIITTDGTPISKYIKYKQIFDVPLWHPSYNVEEEGKTNGGIFFAMQQTTKKTSGFSTLVNEQQLDCLNLARMADYISIKSCINGAVKTLQTNQFEITSKWESDDIASINCEFDLFAIIRKYQQSNEQPEPLPVPVPPTPSVYKIRGTLTEDVAYITLKISGATETVMCSAKSFEYGYNSEATGTLEFVTNKDKIKTLDFSDSCGLGQITAASFKLPELTSINLTGCTFASLTSAASMFAETKLTQCLMPDATFDVCTNTNSMFYVTEQMLTIRIPNATFANVTDAAFMFCACWANTIELTSATFAAATDIHQMFSEVKAAAINMPLATFALATNLNWMFAVGSGNFVLSTVLPSFAAHPTTVSWMFHRYNGDINITGMNCYSVTNADNMFYDCTADSIIVPYSMNAVTSTKGMFQNCKTQAVSDAIANGSLAFSNTTDATSMFAGLKSSSTAVVTWPSLTFAALVTADDMFNGIQMQSLTMAGATFASVTSCTRMFYNCANLVTLSMPSCTFESLPNKATWPTHEPFSVCDKLANITIKSGQYMGISTLTLRFSFVLKLKVVTKASIISIASAGKDQSPSTPSHNRIVLLATRWNQFSAQDQTDIENALPDGWMIVTE